MAFMAIIIKAIRKLILVFTQEYCTHEHADAHLLVLEVTPKFYPYDSCNQYAERAAVEAASIVLFLMC